MQDTLVMRCLDACHHLAHDVCGALRVHSSFATQQIVKSLAFHVLHHKEEHTVRALSEVSDVDNVWMTNRGCGTCLTFEAGDCFTFLQVFIVKNVRAHGLDRDPARLQILIASKIDLTHSSTTESLFQKITRGE